MNKQERVKLEKLKDDMKMQWYIINQAVKAGPMGRRKLEIIERTALTVANDLIAMLHE